MVGRKKNRGKTMPSKTKKGYQVIVRTKEGFRGTEKVSSNRGSRDQKMHKGEIHRRIARPLRKAAKVAVQGSQRADRKKYAERGDILKKERCSRANPLRVMRNR